MAATRGLAQAFPIFLLKELGPQDCRLDSRLHKTQNTSHHTITTNNNSTTTTTIPSRSLHVPPRRKSSLQLLPFAA